MRSAPLGLDLAVQPAHHHLAAHDVATALRVSALAVGLAVVGGMTAPVALHTVFGGTTFLVCIALVIGTLLVLLDLRLREA